MALTEADFWITRRVCETLHGMARGRDEAECLLDMLVAGAAAVNAAMFGTAATTLRYLQTLLPHDGHHLRTESWLHIGQECLSTCAQLLRQTMPCAHMGTASGAKGGDG